MPVRSLAVAGMVGPIQFVTVVMIQGVLQPDYSHIAMPISASGGLAGRLDAEP